MSAHYHAVVKLPGKPDDRSPAMDWERAKRFKARCAERWSATGEVRVNRRGSLSVVGPAGTAWVKLVPCAGGPACCAAGPAPVDGHPRWSRRPVSARRFLLDWAAAHGGEILRAAAMTEAPHQGVSANHVANLLHGEACFERIERGRYRLREQSA